MKFRMSNPTVINLSSRAFLKDCEVRPLSEIAQIVKEIHPPNQKSHFPYIGLEHIDQQTLSLNSIGDSSKAGSNKFKFGSGDILFGKLRPYFRKVYRPKFSGVCSTDIWVFRAKEGVDQGYLFYLLASHEFVSLASSGSSGTRMPRADWEHLKKLNWALPSIKEQREIAKILSDLDEKIELNQQMNETLEGIANSIFKSWFIDFDPVRAKSAGKPTGLPKEIADLFPPCLVESELGKIPKGWNICKLGDFTQILNGVAFKSEDFVDSGIFLLRTRNFTKDGYILRDDTACLPNRFYEEYENSRLNKFDVLLVMVGASVGKIATVQSSILPALQNQNMWNFRANDFSGQLFLRHLVVKIVQENLGTASGSARDFFRKDFFRGINFVRPSESVLKAFNEQASSFINQIDKNLSEITLLSQIRDSLLPKLMSGEIRVKK